jgi:deoxyribose-phosphate aldolase
MDDVTAARKLISCLDLTSLNTADTEDSVSTLCHRATTPYGTVAAVCIWSRFLPFARRCLPTALKLATVINFPAGAADISLLTKELDTALQLGADELDVVLPYRALLNGDRTFCADYLATARELTKDKILKVIIESGELQTVAKIKEAALLCIEAKADFVKTSTGKTKISATPEAANIILETIAQSKQNIGFKASGGIKTTEDAKKYLTLAQAILGADWPTKQYFRIGASSVLTNLMETIKQGY